MPVLEATNYHPKWPFRRGHINTIYPYLFRNKIYPRYERKRFHTADGDFLDLDCLRKGGERLVILLHGLEGSSDSQYMRYMSQLCFDYDYDVIAMNHRGCSGELNNSLVMYHSGFTDDIHAIVGEYSTQYDEIYLVGYSLGANIILKYLNDQIHQIDEKIKAAVAVSVPVHLNSSGRKISTRQNILYEKNFLKSLKSKLKQKAEVFPERVSREVVEGIRSLYEFDDLITGPINGFKNAEDYYTRCSSLQFLHHTKIPTLIINALDDPFLDKPSFPYKVAENNDILYFIPSNFGGHVGFVTFDALYYWHETTALKFIQKKGF